MWVMGLVLAGLAGGTVQLMAGEGHAQHAPPSAQEAPAGDDAVKPYPLDTCLVSGEKLGEMGEAFVMVHKGQEIKFCCKGCVKDFKKDPEKFLTKLTTESAGQEAQPGAGKPEHKKHDEHAGHAH